MVLFKKALVVTSEGAQHSTAKQKISAKEKKEKEIDWAKKRKLEDLVLNEQENDVETLGGRRWTTIPKYSKEAFINANNIPIPQKKRNDGDLGQVVANHMKAKN